VRPLLLTLVLAVSTATAQKPADDPGFAKLPGPVLRIADSARIDVKTAGLEAPFTLFPGPKGSVLVYWQWGNVTAFDSLGRRIWGKQSKRGERDIAEISQVGWRGNEMWVSDAAFSQIALLDQYGNVTKSIELPSWVRPSFSQRKTFPVFESMRVYSLYEDGTMLVIPRSPVKITGATSYEENSNYLLKINEDGIIQRMVAKFPSNMMSGKRADGEKFRIQNPLNQSISRVSADGMRAMLISVDTSDAKFDTVVVRAVNERGDTVFTQKFGYPAQHLTETQMDSVGRSQWGGDSEYREPRQKLLGHRGPAIASVAYDIDKSLWITLRGNASSRSVVGIDAAGKFIGKLQLPAKRTVRAANLGRLWIGDARNDSRGDLVRYRLAR
jgi:hypothetical protein